MSTETPAPSRRALLLILPRQHGAWSALAASFVLGLAAAGSVGLDGLLVLSSVLTGFVAQHAASKYRQLPQRDRRRGPVLAWTAAAALAALASAAVLVLVYRRLAFLIFVPLVMLLALLSLLVERHGKAHSVSGELLAMTGLSLVAPATAYAVTGELSLGSLGLWLLCALYFCGTVFHVRYLVRNRKESTGPLEVRLRTGGPSLLYHLGCAGAGSALSVAGLLPPFAWVALLPAAAKACTAVLAGQAAPLPVRTIGFLELRHMVLFVGLVTLAYALAA